MRIRRTNAHAQLLIRNRSCITLYVNNTTLGTYSLYINLNKRILSTNSSSLSTLKVRVCVSFPLISTYLVGVFHNSCQTLFAQFVIKTAGCLLILWRFSIFNLYSIMHFFLIYSMVSSLNIQTFEYTTLEVRWKNISWFSNTNLRKFKQTELNSTFFSPRTVQQI